MKVSIPKLCRIKFKSGIFADNIEYHPGVDQAEFVSPLYVLQGAILQDLEHVMLIGVHKDGREYCAGTIRDHRMAAYYFGRGNLRMLLEHDVDDEWEDE